MTKRFTNTDNGFIVDYKSKQKVLNLYDVVDVLNELHEEKEQLQHDATILIQSNQDYRKENEQLKQEIIQLRHWNKCLAEKRHQEISYRPYTASKSEEEELQEFLEQKVFNCSDR